MAVALRQQEQKRHHASSGKVINRLDDFDALYFSAMSCDSYDNISIERLGITVLEDMVEQGEPLSSHPATWSVYVNYLHDRLQAACQTRTTSSHTEQKSQR